MADPLREEDAAVIRRPVRAYLAELMFGFI